MLKFLGIFNLTILVLFFVCYFYQAVYVFIGLKHKHSLKTDKSQPKRNHKFAVLICARNESAVIGELLKSLKNQTYPSNCYDVYVVADNCTDDTAQIARDGGAKVYERFNHSLVGKGYALDYAFHIINEERGIRDYEGYLVFDADNVLDSHYLEEMNKVFDKGYSVITSYRNSKNYASNWLSAGYSLWFMRESCYLNGARMECGSSCAISGTGFLVSSRIIEKNHGWKHHLLTEDIEFSVDNAIEGEKIGYCAKAVLYDEQPVEFGASWKQRMRWAKGFYQVLAAYGLKLFKRSVLDHSFQCYDMLMTIAPATLLTLFTIAVNGSITLLGLVTGEFVWAETAFEQVLGSLLGIYFSLFLFGLVTTITEWKRIYAAPSKKILYMFTFPIFIFTYIPIAVAALIRPVKWEPIKHSICKNVQEICQ